MLPPLDPKATPYPVDDRTSLAEFEKMILAETDEIAAAFDAVGRLVLRPRRGTPDEIGFHTSELSLLAGAVVSHNHPLSGGLSAEDAAFAAICGVAELRAVLPSGVVHRLVRPQGSWPDPARMLEASDEAIGALRRENGLRKAAGGSIMGPKEREETLFLYRRDAFRKLGVRMDRTDVWR